jgi:probable DNA metabolism protein
VQDVPAAVGLADRMGDFLARRLGAEVPATVYQAWLSETPGIDDAIVGYLRIGLELGRDPGGLLQRPDVAATMKASRRTGFEAHRFLGLVRFRLRGSLYLSEIEPDTDVLPLIGDHFAARFHDQAFAIHDLRRGRAVLHPPGGRWTIADVAPDGKETSPSAGEDRSPAPQDRFEAMWRRYFQAMAIEERFDPKLQRNHLPKKHWRHLVEEPGAAVAAANARRAEGRPRAP